MGSPETQTPSSKQTTANMASGSSSGSGPDKLEQRVASGGAGGQTSTSGGTGNTDEGYGRAADGAGFEGTSAEGSRSAQGYGGGEDADKSVGA